MPLTEWVLCARSREAALHPEHAHERAELRHTLRALRDCISMPAFCAASGLTEAQVHELSDSYRACRLSTDVLRATPRRVTIAAGYDA